MVKGFCNIGRSVASVLLMVVLSNVHGQPVQPLLLDAYYCPPDHLESQLVSIDDRLNRIETIISLMNNPFIKGDCTVELASNGHDDSTKDGYVKTSGGSSEDVLVLDEQGSYRKYDRGVTLFELDPKTCTTKNRQTFDTYESADDRVQLLETLETATAGTIIVGVTVDTAENEDNVSFRNAVGSFFTRYNMDLSGLRCRDKFAFAMQKGYPKKTIFQSKPHNEDSLKMKIEGQSASDAPHPESQLASIEQRLNRIETTILPMIKGDCTVDLASYWFRDSTEQGYVKTSGGSSENVLVPDGRVRNRGTVRGVTLFELDPTTCRTSKRQTFYTYMFPDDRMQLLETLETATAGTIIVGVTLDTAESGDNESLKNSVGSFFTSYNMNLSRFGYRDKFAFVLQKGYPKKTVFQIERGGGDSLKMKIVIRGSSVYDVTFNRV